MLPKEQKIFIVPLESLRDKIEYKEKEFANISTDEDTESADDDDEDYNAEEDSGEDHDEYTEEDDYGDEEEDEVDDLLVQDIEGKEENDELAPEAELDQDVIMVEAFNLKGFNTDKPKKKKRYDNIVIMKIDQANSGYKCASCGKAFAGFSSLANHWENTCKVQSCPFCELCMVGKTNLIAHIETTHRM